MHYEKFQDGTVKCIEDEIPFEVPKGWEWCRLGNICSQIQYGLSNSAESHGSHRLLRITDIQEGNVNWNSVPFTNVDDDEKYLLQTNDIVFARTGATVGKSFLIKETPFKSVFASYLIRIRLLDGINSDYIYHFFNSACYWSQITDKSVGVGQPNCNGTSLQELFIPLPPTSEQRRIVFAANCFLKNTIIIEDVKDSLSEIISITKSRILDMAIKGKLVPQDPNDEPASILLERIRAEKEELIKQGKLKRDKKESIIYKGDDNSYYHHINHEDSVNVKKIVLPYGWAACELSEISYLIGRKDNQIKTSDILTKGSFPVISQSSDEIDGYCNDTSKVIKDVPIVLFGDHTKNVKYINEPFIIGADGTKLHKFIGINNKYAFYWMLLASQNIRDRGYARHYSLLSKECFYLPPLKEQNRIVAAIENIFKYLDTIIESI